MTSDQPVTENRPYQEDDDLLDACWRCGDPECWGTCPELCSCGDPYCQGHDDDA